LFRLSLLQLGQRFLFFYSKLIVQCHAFPLHAGSDGSFSWRQNHIWHIWIWTAALVILAFDSFGYSYAFIIFKFTFYFDCHLNWLHSQLLHSNCFILYENPQNGVYFVLFLRHVRWENVRKFAALSSSSTSTSLLKKIQPCNVLLDSFVIKPWSILLRGHNFFPLHKMNIALLFFTFMTVMKNITST